MSFLGNTVAAYDAKGETVFERLPAPLRGMQTHAVYLSPNQKHMWNLAGPAKGKQGVRFTSQLTGDQSWPTEQVLINSPYIMGATIARTNVAERKLTAGVVIGSHAPPLTEYQYRMAEAKWWESQDENNDGWFGFYTRFSGWRWIPVRPFETVATPQKIDPTAYGNNVSMWDMTWIASRPYYTKIALYDTFQALHSGDPKPPPAALIGGLYDQVVSPSFYWGTITLANRGTLPSYVQFAISSPGQAVVQDNDSGRLVPLPIMDSSVGTYLCDTEPGKRTLTGANDPQDNLYYEVIRQSKILNFLLSGAGDVGLPIQLRFQNRFIYTIPPKTVVQFTVGHSHPAGTITALVPQRYKRSR